MPYEEKMTTSLWNMTHIVVGLVEESTWTPLPSHICQVRPQILFIIQGFLGQIIFNLTIGHDCYKTPNANFLIRCIKILNIK